MADNFWSDEGRVDTLKTLWTSGKSASEIAAIMGGGVTRNAVIGKANRLKLPLRGQPQRRYCPTLAGWSPARQKRAKPRPVRRSADRVALYMERVENQAGPDLDIAPAQRRQFGDLEPQHCRWPLGDPKEKDFGFCNHDKTPGSSYCAFHATRAGGYPVNLRPRTIDQVGKRWVAPNTLTNPTIEPEFDALETV